MVRGPAPRVARIAWASAGALLLAGAVLLIIFEGKPVLDVLIVAALAGAVVAAHNAFRVHLKLPSAPVAEHPVLFYNPLSGGGKAQRFHIAEEATRRGIEPIELRRGDHLEQLVRAAVRRGADGLAMAGGDGSQAIVAMIAAESGLPYACIPAVLVSNNSYRLGRALGSGTRPLLDRGQLGIAVIGAARRRGGGQPSRRGVQQWSAPIFEIGSDRPVPAGIDGEATVLDPPLRFRTRAGALRVRIAPGHRSVPVGT